MDLSIIIVNWRSSAYVQACIRSIREQTLNVEHEIIVVDNASFDSCGEMCSNLFPTVTFVQSQSNIGFARANNLGAQHARGKVLLFLNPDTEVRDRAVERLYSCIITIPDVGVLACRLLNTDGTLQYCCVQPFPTIWNQLLDAEVCQVLFSRYRTWVNASTYERQHAVTPAEVEAVSGACMMICRDVFDRVGGFSTDYFMYTEDLDLCQKTHLAGLKNFYLRDPTIVHHGGGSTRQSRSSFATVMMRESIRRFLRKFRGCGYAHTYRILLGLASVARICLLLGLSPLYLLRREPRILRSSLWKWIAILRWSAGVERWIRTYENPARIRGQEDKVSACVDSAAN